MSYVIYDETSKILRVVQCSPVMSKIQAKEGEFVLEGEANDSTQKVEFDGLDGDGQPINPGVVDKTPEEIEANESSKPKLIPHGKRPANVTNEQLDDIMNRLNALEEAGENNE